MLKGLPWFFQTQAIPTHISYISDDPRVKLSWVDKSLLLGTWVDEGHLPGIRVDDLFSVGHCRGIV